MKYRADEWAYESILEDSTLLVGDTIVQNYFAAMDPTDLAKASRANMALAVPDSVLAFVEMVQIHPVTNILDNQKGVQGIRVDDGEIDSLELVKLLSIASQCEDLGGSAVNIARSMLASEGIFIWQDPGCDKIAAPVKKASDPIATSATGIVADCWPNPSSG